MGEGVGRRKRMGESTYSCNGFSSWALARGGASSLSCGPRPLVLSPDMSGMDLDRE